MKKLLTLSILALTSSLAHAGAGCDENKCDKKTGETAGLTIHSSLVACGGDKKDDKEKGGATGLTETSSLVAGSCGDKKGDNKEGKSTSDLTQVDSSIA
ncbi:MULTISPECIES: hypothetical protein [unclassified Lentimonas]|uniref:hypothetical protein n=1 Tax=unclassified Lentimonas TaxID=2630993 RepID=UPI001324CE9D|nr:MULTISPECIES: hypothetical protein [unclassified Lentimonas]CAA6678031.1 Unannotated [Lentimonas sp. CC4]CAA6687005.1 Unannotated [Lentimonas sp. CC6]CAA6696751.1 Unannotated [Lentimonas sp. CC10]CAA6697297.1 Unannotated [Lentimonas sp. CC19]CAA7072272.1 Unannotated [Lentimonas sp. CC11]